MFQKGLYAACHGECRRFEVAQHQPGECFFDQVESHHAGTDVALDIVTADYQAHIFRVDDDDDAAKTKGHAQTTDTTETNEDYANDIEMNREFTLMLASRG